MPVCQRIVIKTRYWYGRLGTGMTSQYGVSLALALGLMLTPHQSLHVDTGCLAGLSADRHQDVVLVWTSRHWYDISVRRVPRARLGSDAHTTPVLARRHWLPCRPVSGSSSRRGTGMDVSALVNRISIYEISVSVRRVPRARLGSDAHTTPVLARRHWLPCRSVSGSSSRRGTGMDVSALV